MTKVRFYIDKYKTLNVIKNQFPPEIAGEIKKVIDGMPMFAVTTRTITIGQDDELCPKCGEKIDKEEPQK